jgi:hypothetical protein
MARTRPSGLPIVEPDSLVIAEEVAKIDGRGRLRLLPRWTARIAWWSDDDPFEVLMVFDEPGRITLRDWKTDGLRVVTRYEELKQRDDQDALEALRLLADRYQRLRFDREKCAHVGDAALAHFKFPIERGAERIVYVAIFPELLVLLSPAYRDAKLTLGSPLLDDLP